MISVGVLAVARQRNGGTLLYTLSMLEALASLPPSSYRVSVFAGRNNHEYDELGLPVAEAPRALKLLGKRLLGRNPYSCVDVVLAPVYSTSLLVCGRPFAFTLHDLQERHYPEYFSLPVRIWRRLTNWLLANRARLVVCESAFVRNDIIQFVGIDENKVVVLPAPPVATLFPRMSDPAAVEMVSKKFSLPEQYVFYPAQFWPHKNHRRLVDAFALVLRRHPACVLVLTGKQRDQYERVMMRVRELGLSASVRHIGYVEQSELASLYKGATVAAIPTLFESISIPVYEAFSVGCAVCASNVVALPDQVGDAGLLFDPCSIEDIADKICSLLDDPGLRARLIENGRSRMASVGQDEYAEKLATIVNRLAGTKGP